MIAVEEAIGKPASSRLAAVSYRIEVADDLDWDAACERFMASDEITVTRSMLGKADKRVDVRMFCSSLEYRPGRLLVELELLGPGNRPARRDRKRGRSPGGRDPRHRTARAHRDCAARRARRSNRMTTIAHVPKEILISSDLSELRVAVLEEGRASEVYVERRGEGSIAGNIYRAKVDNVLRGMEAAFIELGLPKNGFLHVDDVMLPGMDTSSRRKKKIDELLKPGQEVLVQVVKNPMGTKGARVTMELSIAGRFLVLTPGGEGAGVSKRLPDAERERLRKLVKQLELDDEGVIARTAAEGATMEDLERDLRFLRKIWAQIETRAQDRPRGRRWCSARPTCRCASSATCCRATSRRCWSTPSASTGGSSGSCARRSPSWPSGSSSTPAPSRCSSATASRRRSARRSTGASTCRPAAT